MTWLLATLGVAFASALIPVVNIEAYLIALTLSQHPAVHLLALAAAVGQMGGKMIFWAVGAGLMSAERVSRKGKAKGRWAQRMDRLQQWCTQHRWGPALVTLVSAVVGLPPFAVWSVLAGSIAMPWWQFLALGTLGRYLRFAAIILAPGLLPGT